VRVPDPGKLLSCSFCGTSQQQAEKLIAVPPHMYICDGCVSHAHAVIAGQGQTVSTPIATIHRVGEEAGTQQCGFCGKQRHQVAGLASAGDTRTICDECLELCDKILGEEPPSPRPDRFSRRGRP
jgi:ATP-dependent protease Clp ATPase subunit